MPHRTLVLGGIRSGKSEWAERQLSADPSVRYLATMPHPRDGTAGVPAGDAEWAKRIAAHRARRPAHWSTAETIDVAGELQAAGAGSSLLIDDIGGWLTGVLQHAPGSAGSAVDELVAAWSAYAGRAVAVSSEVGLSLVAQTALGRRFADLLGEANRALADASEEVVLVVAGRPLWLHGGPR